VEEFHLEVAELDLAISRHSVQFAIGQQTRFLQLDLRKTARQGRRVHGHIEIFEQIWQRADMVLVAMCQQDRLHPVRAFRQVGDFGVDQIDAGHVALRKHQARIDDQNIAIVL